ncbi:hypothetical protein MUTS15_49880 [Escherichia coli]|nr:hypothetical protein MUTS15_49880 [Escherichia coli]BDZ04894.1 hypothetical protein MUTS16_59670 [Escherichia coli]
MLVKTIAELNMARESGLYTLLEFIGNPITAMFIAVFVAYYVLGIRQHMSMGTMLTHTENGFGSIANILLIIGAGGAFNAILKAAVSLIRWQLFSPICICTRFFWPGWWHLFCMLQWAPLRWQ